MDKLKIAERLRELRGDKSQREVAEAVGTTAMAISLYESGDRVPKDEIKIRLARYYKTTVDALFYA
jgi:transcriptional regulator with XRE-family HTH domain